MPEKQTFLRIDVSEAGVPSSTKPVIRLTQSHVEGLLRRFGYLGADQKLRLVMNSENPEQFEMIARKFPQIAETNDGWVLDVSQEMIATYFDVAKYNDPETGVLAVKEALNLVFILQQEIIQINPKNVLGIVSKTMELPLNEITRASLEEKFLRFSELSLQIKKITPLLPVILEGIVGLKKHLIENPDLVNILSTGDQRQSVLPENTLVGGLTTWETMIKASEGRFASDLDQMDKAKIKITAYLDGTPN